MSYKNQIGHRTNLDLIICKGSDTQGKNGLKWYGEAAGDKSKDIEGISAEMSQKHVSRHLEKFINISLNFFRKSARKQFFIVLIIFRDFLKIKVRFWTKNKITKFVDLSDF